MNRRWRCLLLLLTLGAACGGSMSIAPGDGGGGSAGQDGPPATTGGTGGTPAPRDAPGSESSPPEPVPGVDARATDATADAPAAAADGAADRPVDLPVAAADGAADRPVDLPVAAADGAADLSLAPADAAGDLPPPLHDCTMAGMVMRCQLTQPLNAPMGTLECACRCFHPDTPATRASCDPVQFSCCGWRAAVETCHCASAMYLSHTSMSCPQYLGTDTPVPRCP